MAKIGLEGLDGRTYEWTDKVTYRGTLLSKSHRHISNSVIGDSRQCILPELMENEYSSLYPHKGIYCLHTNKILIEYAYMHLSIYLSIHAISFISYRYIVANTSFKKILEILNS